MPVADSQGTVFEFAGNEFVAKNVKVKRSQSYVDVTPLSAEAGSVRQLQKAPLRDGDQITCEYWGDTAPTLGESGDISCNTLGVFGSAVCEDFELAAAVGELIVGNATFKLTG